MACSSLLRESLEKYISQANDVIYFKLIRDEKDLEEDLKENTFHPDMSHQIFGDSETIFGYQDLKIQLFYSASRLIRYVNVSFSDTVDPKTAGGVEPDNILVKLKESVQGNFLCNIDKFSQELLKEASFKPFGELIDVVKIETKKNENGSEIVKELTYEIYIPEINQEFIDYHENMQTFLLWFIDAASYIDINDDRWDFFLVYEKVNAHSVNGNANSSTTSPFIYHFVGYMTIYRYYAYPDKIRPRISQVLILPPFQRRGIGAKLLQSVYNHYLANSTVLDITVEDPSENFTRLRDHLDAKNCMKLSSFQPESLLKGWSEEIVKEAHSKLKLSKRQIRRIYEILKLRCIDKSDKDIYKKYRLEIKNRLNAPFTKRKKTFLPSINGDLNSIAELKIEELTALYNQLEDDYQQTIERLDVSN